LLALTLAAYVVGQCRRMTPDRKPSGQSAESLGFPFKERSGLSSSEIAHNENYFGIGRLQNRDYKGAIEKFLLATKLEFSNPEYHTNLAIAYSKNRQPDNAIAHFIIALKLKPESPKALARLGDVYFDREQWQQAAATYDRAILQEAKDHKTLFNAAQAYFEADQPVKAMKTVDSAIALKEDDPDYLTLSGIIKCRFENYDEAVRDFRSAKRISPDHPGIDEWIAYAESGGKGSVMPIPEGKTSRSVQGDAVPTQTLEELNRRMEKIKESFRARQEELRQTTVK